MELIDFFKNLNWQPLLAIFAISAILWISSNHFKSRIRRLELGLTSQAARTDRLYEMFVDLLKEKK